VANSLESRKENPGQSKTENQKQEKNQKVSTNKNNCKIMTRKKKKSIKNSIKR
jgi:hypothetical protein